MKFIKWKSLIITSIVCLLPMLLGIALFDALPDNMAIHFDINNKPDNYASKEFTVFGLPVLMAILQIVCCFINDINAKKHGDRIKLETVTKWIIPIMSMILYIVTLGYSLGWNLDIRKVAAVIVGIIFLVIGNYLPKFGYVDYGDKVTEKTIKINRFIAHETVILGILFLISIFLPPIATIVCIILLIPYALSSIIYGIKVGTKK